MKFTFTEHDLFVGEQVQTLNALKRDRRPPESIGVDELRELVARLADAPLSHPTEGSWMRVAIDQFHKQLVVERQPLMPWQAMTLFGLSQWDTDIGRRQMTLEHDDMVEQVQTLNDLKFRRWPPELWMQEAIDQFHQQFVENRQPLLPWQALTLFGLSQWNVEIVDDGTPLDLGDPTP